MQVAIIGAGALGCLFGGALAVAGHEVWFLHHRDEYVDYVNDHGLHIRSDFRPRLAAASPLDVPATTDTSTVGTVDLALILVKSHQTKKALSEHSTCLGPETAVLSLQNGLRNYTNVREEAGAERALGGITYQGGVLTAPGEVTHTSDGKSILGGKNESTRNRAGKALQAAGFTVKVVDDPQPFIWDKQMVSLAIKPLAALTRLPNYALVSSDELVAIMEATVDEAKTVARAKDIELIKEDIVTDLVTLLSKNDENSESHKSSMLQDVEAGRKTEIEEINGAIVELAEEENIPVPYNRVLTTLVHGLERSYLSE